MEILCPETARIAPDLVRRTCGGWLAIAPQGARFAVAVTAATAQEAKERFVFVYKRWVQIVDAKALDVPKSA
ncbi:MAG: hypothetical protein ACKVP4_13640 [Hyphomicrobium sp.]